MTHETLFAANWKIAVFLFAVLPVTSRAQTFNLVASFDGTNGNNPQGTLVQGADGRLYGTTQFGGAFDEGAFYAVSTGGVLTALYSFPANNAHYPIWGVVFATDGNFYGPSEPRSSGNAGFGSLYSMTATGTFTSLIKFNGYNGAWPNGLIQAPNGDFYGTAGGGGINSCTPSSYGDCGIAFRITASGEYEILHDFSPTDYEATPDSALVQANDGNFYGTTRFNGLDSGGTIFRMTPDGSVKEVAGFLNSGAPNNPTGLVVANDGSLYGTLRSGGTGNAGAVFQLTLGGTLTILYNFCSQTGCADGSYPSVALMQGTDGNLYGTTAEGGTFGFGTIFSITTGGVLATLHSFDSSNEGEASMASLLQATDGHFYGTTIGTQQGSYGAVFSLNMGLKPFVKTLPTSGAAGAAVTILGNDLSGATAVSFNGTVAAFTIVSSTEISATVPAGATSGKLHVVTPRGVLASNVAFRVH